MITEHTKRRIAIVAAAIGGAVWIAEMVYLGVAVLTIKALFWP